MSISELGAARLAGVGLERDQGTHSSAGPAFAGCVFVVGLVTLSYRVAQWLSSDQRGRLDTGFLGCWDDPQATTAPRLPHRPGCQRTRASIKAHFAAWEQPALHAKEIRDCFAKVR